MFCLLSSNICWYHILLLFLSVLFKSKEHIRRYQLLIFVEKIHDFVISDWLHRVFEMCNHSIGQQLHQFIYTIYKRVVWNCLICWIDRVFLLEMELFKWLFGFRCLPIFVKFLITHLFQFGFLSMKIYWETFNYFFSEK